MKTVNEFIVEIGKAFSNTMEHGSLKLFVDHRDKQQEQSNRIGTVKQIPAGVETDIKEGAEVMIDPTVLFEQNYRGKMQKSRFLIDEDKGTYRVPPSLILFYRNPGATKPVGNGDNLFALPVTERIEKVGNIYLPQAVNETETLAQVKIPNRKLLAEGIGEGDYIHHSPNRKWFFKYKDEELLFLRNVDVLAKAL